MTKRNLLHLLAVVVLVLTFSGTSQAQEGSAQAEASALATAAGTNFTYQGRLTVGGIPANGRYDFEFQLFTAPGSGGTASDVVAIMGQTVTGGLFTVELDFGEVFRGNAIYLEVRVRASGSGEAFTPLTPRQAITAAPYAQFALKTAAHDHFGDTWTGSSGADGLRLQHTAASGARSGVSASSASTQGTGVLGEATATDGTTYGVRGVNSSPQGAGVFGESTDGVGTAPGVRGRTTSQNASGVRGDNDDTIGYGFGVWGRSSSPYGGGVAGTGNMYGVYGETQTTYGRGVHGVNIAETGINFGVYGESLSTSGTGVYGVAFNSNGSNYGVRGESNSESGVGVHGKVPMDSLGAGVVGEGSTGVRGTSDGPQGIGVVGFATSSTGVNYGVWGVTNSATGYAGYFGGQVQIDGTLSKAGGSFKIDHPLDPENKYLSHSFVESPDMMNVYNGNVTLDGNGEAQVALPDYFEALNRDFRYQLTPIGGWAPIYIAQEIEGNAFRIAGGESGLKVSWQVTGIRQDAWAEANRIVVEEAKTAEEQGRYLHPEALGQPKSLDVDYERERQLLERSEASRATDR